MWISLSLHITSRNAASPKTPAYIIYARTLDESVFVGFADGADDDEAAGVVDLELELECD
jgi:hypothetical protein